jgi:hypothetical protein
VRSPLADRVAHPGAESGEEDRPELRAALLSVYYASLGNRFEIRGAPSMLIRPQVRLVPLRDALAILWDESPTRFREAVWLLVRSTRLQGTADDPKERYRPELASYIPREDLKALGEARREYRAGANLFAAALVAVRDDNRGQLAAIRGVIEEVPASSTTRSFADAVALLFGEAPAELLARMTEPSEWERARVQMSKIESEVGLDLYDFVEEFANAVAFNEWAGIHLSRGNWAAPTDEGALSVLPVSSVVVQDTESLQAKATVTTLVTGDFSELRAATDPRLWSKSSDIMKRTNYVSSPFPEGLGAVTEAAQEAIAGPVGTGFRGVRLLEEEGTFTWGPNDEQSIWFNNIFRIRHEVGSRADRSREDVDIRYGLCRSIESMVLWDRRPGGLLVDEGYLKARSLGSHRWRVTWSKAIRFSDRTPYSGSPGWTDFGELLNYLAPAALTWWLETETYSLGDRPYTAPRAEASSYAKVAHQVRPTELRGKAP